MENLDFKALETRRDGSFGEASYRFEGDSTTGWRIIRNDLVHLEIPAGYHLLKSLRCGICSTDLSRHHLPFPLPQVIGHEVIAEDNGGRVVASEINASHLATGSPLAEECPFCRQGLPTHCPERLVLGIDRLPGGFSPWILVPAANIIDIPEGLDETVSVLIEPFAAALHAVRRLDLHGASRVAVLGVGRLGLLIVAALNAARDDAAGAVKIEAIDRNRDRLDQAASLGADETWSDTSDISAGPGSPPPFDIVVEATGSVEGLRIALSLASREVHIKSTTGLETFGVRHLTELVVDEVDLDRFEPGLERGSFTPPDCDGTAIILGSAASSVAARPLDRAGIQVIKFDSIDDLRRDSNRRPLACDLQADIVIVDSIEALDHALRPWPDLERGLVKPRGMILLADTNQEREGLLSPILDNGIRLTTSRCGDFNKAIPAMVALQEKGFDLGGIVTDNFPAQALPEAFERARSPESIKVTVLHDR